MHALAARTQNLANKLAAGTAPTELETLSWSSAAAVNAAAMVTGDAFAAQTHATAAKISAAGAGFNAQKASSSGELAALANR